MGLGISDISDTGFGVSVWLPNFLIPDAQQFVVSCHVLTFPTSL